MQKVKVLYVITKLELGGAQKHLLGLIACLDKTRFTPFLFTSSDGPLLQEARTIAGLFLTESSWLKRSAHPFKDLLALYQIYCFVKKHNISIVHTHSSKAGVLGRIAAKLARVKVIVHTVHGWSFNEYQPFFLRGFFILLEKICARFSDSIIVVSTHDRQKGLMHNIGKPSSYALIRYAVSPQDFRAPRSTLRQEFAIAEEELVVGSIGCFKPQKSPLDFVRLASLVTEQNPYVKFILVGDGVLRARIERLIARLGLQKKVILAGWRRDIPKMLSLFDVFVLTSLWEGLPIAVLEAMASSKPVVVTDTGGVREIIHEGRTGFLVARRDIAAMAKKINLLLKNCSLRSAIGSSARDALGEEFDPAKMASHTQHVYEQAFTAH